ncbi:MAG: D-lyxose/D-mannose family sugar isomerase [Eubacteriales bacterium]|nr:D-lyxose/D-mannose family sugar isomerase [Eubacteriales bacterium]
MKRSAINLLIKETIAWLEERQVALPPFAYWTPAEWAEKGHEYDEIRENMLGWDVTDYGRGDFDDHIDNRFHETQERFTSIEEDEPAAYLLCNEYPEAR